MTETAPERIWASPTNGRPHGSWNDTSVDAAIEAEYVRADLYTAQQETIAALVEALEAAEEHLVSLGFDGAASGIYAALARAKEQA